MTNLPDSPLISVITVSLNAAPSIARTMDSVLSQTYPRIEYLVIDGASTDGTAEIIRTYAPRLAYWHSRPDGGVAQAFNAGLAQAHGDWLLFLNADDFFVNARVVEGMVPYLRLHREADVVYGQVEIIPPDQGARPFPFGRLLGQPWSWQTFRMYNIIPHQGAFTNRRYVARMGNFDERCTIAVDYDYYLRGGPGLQAVFVPQLISKMRLGGLSNRHIVSSWQEYRRAQVKNRALPPWAADLNYYYRLLTYYGRLGQLQARTLAAGAAPSPEPEKISSDSPGPTPLSGTPPPGLGRLKKSHFTRLQKLCLQGRLHRLLPLVTWLEAAHILLSRGDWATLADLSLAYCRYGEDQLRRRHLLPEYYQKWLARQERRQPSGWEPNQTPPQYLPTISLIVAAGPQDGPGLPLFLESVRGQEYPHWEVILLGTGPEQGEAGALAGLAEGDSRIRVLPGEAGWAAAGGKWLIFPGSDIRLAPTALREIVQYLNLHPQADILYTDEDVMDPAGQRRDPFFKPAWSPDLALNLAYTGPLTVFRRSLVESLGGLPEPLGPAAHHDILLRSLPHTRPEAIHHLPRILSHRLHGAEKAGREEAALRQILEDHLVRSGEAGQVLPGQVPGTCRYRREIRDPVPVSILIPFKDKVELLRQCLDGLFNKTDYPSFEVILINNQSREQATRDYLAGLAGHPQVRILAYDQPFNFADMNNRAAEQARHPYILFLNNDIEVISPGWLRAMVEHIQRPEVGAVGAKLLYPNGAMQHGGLALGGGGWLCGDFFRGVPESTPPVHVLSQVVRNCSAVTAACLLTKKDLFEEVGGFDEVHLPVCYNDVDLCLKLRQRGYLIVWTPYARLYHHESASRGRRPRLADLERLVREQQFFEKKWWPVIQQDPYFNQNLSRLFDGYVF